MYFKRLIFIIALMNFYNFSYANDLESPEQENLVESLQNNLGEKKLEENLKLEDFQKNFILDSKEINTKTDLYEALLSTRKKIHELQKEKYILSSQAKEKQRAEEAIKALASKSGAYISLGLIVSNSNNLTNYYGLVNLGYLQFYKFDIGLRFNAFYAYGNDYAFGYDFALIKDFKIYKNNYFGILAGVNVYLKKDKKLYTSTNFGFSFTILDHHRIEFVRNTIFNQGSLNISYSYVF